MELYSQAAALAERFSGLSSDEQKNAYDTYLTESNEAWNEHRRLWRVLRKLFEQDLVSGRCTTLELAETLDLIQRGEGRSFDLYRN
ncbi:hypothetical protein NMD10_27860 (plasmid) [Citrobacter portucalensis]|uniref:hypothetical protein n=1 Tax=Citrobacter portucalensis TaxID=1639133 RepID=UPI00351CB882